MPFFGYGFTCRDPNCPNGSDPHCESDSHAYCTSPTLHPAPLPGIADSIRNPNPVNEEETRLDPAQPKEVQPSLAAGSGIDLSMIPGLEKTATGTFSFVKGDSDNNTIDSTKNVVTERAGNKVPVVGEINGGSTKLSWKLRKRVSHEHQQRQQESGKEVLAEAGNFSRRDQSSDQQDPASTEQIMDRKEGNVVVKQSQLASWTKAATFASRTDRSDGAENSAAEAKQNNEKEDSNIVQQLHQMSLAKELALDLPNHRSGSTESLTSNIKDESDQAPEAGTSSSRTQMLDKDACEFGRPSRIFTGDSAFDGGEDNRTEFNAPRRTATEDSAFYSDGSIENTRSQLGKRRSIRAKEDN